MFSSGHSGVQKETETPEDPHVGWDCENSYGGWLKNRQWHVNDHLCQNR